MSHNSTVRRTQNTGGRCSRLSFHVVGRSNERRSAEWQPTCSVIPSNGNGMSISTRLVIVLTLAVGAIMGAAGYVLVHRQASALMSHRRSEAMAHAITLQLALDNDYRAGRIDDAKRLIDRLSENLKIEGVVLYDEHGNVEATPSALAGGEFGNSPDVERVIETGATIERIRTINGVDFLSVTMPLDLGAGRRGAFEIIEVLTFVKADIAQAQLNVAATTFLLIVTIFIVVYFVARRNVARPIRSLLAGARALGSGDLSHRVALPAWGSEFGELAAEFNRMVSRLEEQRLEVAREADERLALEREFRHNERLALVGRLAAGVAHEVGAPLNVIDGRAEQLLAKPDAPLDQRQRNLTIIRNQTHRIVRIVRQLLDLARPYSMRIVPVDLSALASGVCELLSTETSTAGISVNFSTAGHVVVDADADLLQQVLLNICMNAVQAMPDGGTLRVDVSEHSGSAAVRIEDTGHGILPEHIEHIFEPFFTTKDVGRGTGLGLSVSRRVVEDHGGRILVSRPSAGGAVFTIQIPLTGSAESNTKNPSVDKEVLGEQGAVARR